MQLFPSVRLGKEKKVAAFFSIVVVYEGIASIQPIKQVFTAIEHGTYVYQFPYCCNNCIPLTLTQVLGTWTASSVHTPS